MKLKVNGGNKEILERNLDKLFKSLRLWQEAEEFLRKRILKKRKPWVGIGIDMKMRCIF